MPIKFLPLKKFEIQGSNLNELNVKTMLTSFSFGMDNLKIVIFIGNILDQRFWKFVVFLIILSLRVGIASWSEVRATSMHLVQFYLLLSKLGEETP